MTERFGPFHNLPALTPDKVTDAFNRITVEQNLKEPRREVQTLALSGALLFLRRLTTEMGDLTVPERHVPYRRGIRAGVILSEGYEPARSLDQALQTAKARQREDDIVHGYPTNGVFTMTLNWKLREHEKGNQFLDAIDGAHSLYRPLYGPFKQREPAVAERLYQEPLDPEPRHALLIALGVMDTLDTFRAAAMSQT